MPGFDLPHFGTVQIDADVTSPHLPCLPSPCANLSSFYSPNSSSTDLICLLQVTKERFWQALIGQLSRPHIKPLLHHLHSLYPVCRAHLFSQLCKPWALHIHGPRPCSPKHQMEPQPSAHPTPSCDSANMVLGAEQRAALPYG